MPFILNIGFDNSNRLKNDSYNFEYKGVRFRLEQNDPLKWSDVLMTMVPNSHSLANETVKSLAGEFLSALSWQNSARVTVRFLGGQGVPSNFDLRQAKCQVFDFPMIPCQDNLRGFDIGFIPAIETEEQRIALVLFREAFSSNKTLFSFLLYWQILEIGGNKPVEWINTVMARRADLDISKTDIDQLNAGTKTLGEYLLQDFRHAIAHIRRYAGRKSLHFDLSEEHIRFAVATRVVQGMAKHFIKHDLNLAKMLRLVETKDLPFPTYRSAK